jgi:hypothetical protein
VLARSRAHSAALLDFGRHKEVALWFEHDLFCQVNLLYLLDWFASRSMDGTRLSLICIDAFPGIEDFRGLGQLTPEQMASLFDTRGEVTSREMELAARAWAAYCSPDPRALTDLLDEDTSALPFLADALRRHLARFPSVENGLGRIEGTALELVASGRRDFGTLFAEFGRAEPAYGFGDFQFWLALERLGSGREPMLTIEGAQAARDTLQSGGLLGVACDVTDAGRAVLAGEADFVERNGIDVWLGGVHVRDGGPIWRWDGAALRRAE